MARNSARGLSQTATRYHQDWGFISRLDWGRSAAKLLHGCLEVRGPQFPAGVALSPLAHVLSNTAAHNIKASEGENLLVRQNSEFIASSEKWHPVTLAIFCWLEASHQTSPYPEEESYTGT